MIIVVEDAELIRMAGVHPYESVATAVNYLLHGGPAISKAINRDILKARLLDLLEQAAYKMRPAIESKEQDRG